MLDSFELAILGFLFGRFGMTMDQEKRKTVWQRWPVLVSDWSIFCVSVGDDNKRVRKSFPSFSRIYKQDVQVDGKEGMEIREYSGE